MIAANSNAPSTAASTLIPSLRTLINLAIGGFAGLVLWEIWARFITKAVVGDPLEPAGLIDALAHHNFGVAVPYLLREAIHYGIGILGYPIAYFVISRLLPRWSLVLDLITLLTFSVAIILLAMHGGANGLHFLFWAFVAALVASRAINPSAKIRDALVWGYFTWFNALGLMAPLAGLSFYALGDSAPLSFMSFVGHVIYGAVAVLVFQWREEKA